METAPTLVRLWDYGWLCRDRVELSGASSDAALIEQYVASPAFHTSFQPNDKDESSLHGPFVAERALERGPEVGRRLGDLFHEWGSVLFVFREFLFISPERDSVERFVIGYD